MIQKIAIFPGTFDPFTNGHLDIALKGEAIFDKLIIAIGHNPNKKTLFTVEQRMGWIKSIFKSYPKIEVDTYLGLTSEFCKLKNAKFIIRGLRTFADFEYEKQISRVNEHLLPGLTNIFLIGNEHVNSVSSTVVRELILQKGDFQSFIPPEISADL